MRNRKNEQSERSQTKSQYFCREQSKLGTQRLKFRLWSCIHCIMIRVEKIAEKLGKK